jgi:hypothetical protein
VNEAGVVTAVAPGKSSISVEGVSDGAKAGATLGVVVNAARKIRVDDTLIGTVLKVNGKEAYTSCAGTAPLPFILEGRSEKGGSISLQTAKVTMKFGVVDYTKGTPLQPVFITEQPEFTVTGKTLVPAQVKELTRAAVWAEVDLDGAKFTTNKVFMDLEPAVTLTTPATVVTSSGHLGNFTPAKVNDGIATDSAGSSKWSASGKEPSWLAFDLGKVSKVSEVEILFNTLDQAYSNTPETMEVQVSADGKNWTPHATLTPPPVGRGANFGFTDTFRFKPVRTQYLRLSFPTGNPKGDSVDLLEVKIKASLINNLAMSAKVTTSSISNANYPGENAVDGIVGEHGRGEWASKSEADPWFQLEWSDKVAIRRIVLRDRPNSNDHLRQGTLSFSDGSRIEVTDIPNDGSPKVIEVPAKTVQWIKFQGTANKPGNNGLSEVEVFGAD